MPKAKTETSRSSRRTKTRPQHDGGSIVDESSVQVEPPKHDKGPTNMTDDTSILSFSEDITNAEAPEPLPIGDYTAEIREASGKLSSRGNTYASVVFYIPIDQYPVDYDAALAPDGVTLRYNRLVIEDTPQGRFNVRRFCEAIQAPTSTQIDLNDWVGLTGRVTVDHEEYEGVVRAVIKKVSLVD